MKDDDRLAKAGSPEEQRLLRSADAISVPDHVQEQVRRQIDARIAGQTPGNGKRWRLMFVVAGIAVAGTAAAQNQSALQRLWEHVTGSATGVEAARKGSARASAVRTPAAPTIEALPAGAPKAGMPPSARSTGGLTVPPPRATTTVERSVRIPPRPEGPRFDLDGFFNTPPDPAAAPAPATNGPAADLVIARVGRKDVVLRVTGTTIRGNVRGRSLALTVSPTTITGRIGDDELRINILGTRRADGAVGGRELGFTFNPTEHGWIAGASLPDVGGRVSLDTARLSFFPGCDNDLPAVAGRPGTFEGTCSDGSPVAIRLPPTFLSLPDQVRMIVLGMLLPEPDPAERDLRPSLFPPP